MPRTALTTSTVSSAGLDLLSSAAAANVLGNSMAWADGTFLYVNNASGGSINVTIPTPSTAETAISDGLAITDRVVAVPAGTYRVIHIGRKAAYRQLSGPINNGREVYIDYSAVTSVTVLAFTFASSY